MNKRGLAHLEIILSFVLFIGFLLFGIYFFNPLDTSRVLDSTLFYAYDEISTNVTSNLMIYGVVVTDPQAPNIVAIPIAGLIGKGVRVEDSTGKSLQVTKNNGEAKVIFKREGATFVFIKAGDFDFTATPLVVSSEGELNEEQYSISSSDRRGVVSEKLFRELNESYIPYYVSVKEQFNLPQRTQFGFSLTLPDTSIVAERPIPQDIPVVVKQERLEVVRKEGVSVFGELAVKVW